MACFFQKHILSEYKFDRFVESVSPTFWMISGTQESYGSVLPAWYSCLYLLQTGEASENYNFALTWKPSLVIYYEAVFLVNVHFPPVTFIEIWILSFITFQPVTNTTRQFSHLRLFLCLADCNDMISPISRLHSEKMNINQVTDMLSRCYIWTHNFSS